MSFDSRTSMLRTRKKGKTKAKTKQNHTVGTIPKSNIKMVERGKIDTINT
jgi:hypothetical protein